MSVSEKKPPIIKIWCECLGMFTEHRKIESDKAECLKCGEQKSNLWGLHRDG